MANNDSATPITTGTQTGNKLKERGIYYFKLGSEYFLYDEDEQRLCGLTGAEIDSNFHFLSGFDIKDVEINYSAGTVVITRVNDEYEPIVLDITQAHPNNLVYSAETGELRLVYPDGTELLADGFFIDEGKYDLKVYTDGTLTGLGTEYSPLALSRLERTGTFAPVETLVESGNVEDYKGKRILTKELIDDYGHLYTYAEVEAIQAALEAENSPWRVATKQDWDEMLNAMEDEEHRDHDTCEDTTCGLAAGSILKSNRYWEYSAGITSENNGHYVGFDALPVGYAQSRGFLMPSEDGDIEGFGTLAGFWTYQVADYCEDSDNPFVKVLRTTDDVYQQQENKLASHSVRLVREFTPECDEEYETILGSSYPVGVITGVCDDYSKVWTLSNFYSVGNGFSGKTIEGENIPKLDKYAYFINECDGQKKRMKEGESVVILENNPNRHEFRIVDGELVDTYHEIDKDIATLSANILTHIDEFSAGTVTEFENVRNEIVELSANTVAALTDFRTRTTEVIVSVNDRLDNKINELSAGTENLVSELAANTEAAIVTLSANTDNAIRTLESDVNRFASDTINEIVAIKSDVATLKTDSATKEELNEETVRAEVAETELLEAITELSGSSMALLHENATNIAETSNALSELSATVASQHGTNEGKVGTLSGNLITLSASTVGLSETLNDTITELYGIQEQLENNIAETSGETLDQAKEYTDQQIDAVNAVKVNDLYFDSLSNYIKLIKADGTLTEGISAEDFLKDSVLTRVEYDEGNERLVFVWNDDDTSRTYIPLTKLSNVYGIATDSLAFLKMSGTNISAIVDNADGFEKTLATTKFVEDIASATNAVLAELVEANNENREDIDRLNGDKTVAGSVEHTVNDKFNESLLTAGLPVTTVTLDDARNHSLIRTIITDGETKYFVSNNAKDMLAEDKDGYTISLNHYINTLETKVAALESENSSLKTRVAILERRVDDIAATGIDETMVRNIVKNMLVGTDREIKVTETGELGQTLQIGFADNAIFGDYLAN